MADPRNPSGRQHERFDVDWRVTLKCPDWRFAGRVAASNASRGGLFLLTTKPPRVGSAVELAIDLPDGSRLRLRAVVQHVVTPERAAATGRSPGIGVRIDARHAADLMLLEQMAGAAAEGRVGPAQSRAGPLPKPEVTEHSAAGPVPGAGGERGSKLARLPTRQAVRPIVERSRVTPLPEGERSASQAGPLPGRSASQAGPLPGRSASQAAPLPGRSASQAGPLPGQPRSASQAGFLPGQPRSASQAARLPTQPRVSAPADPAPPAAAPTAWVRPPGAVARVVGIDFGTTYSSLSVAIGNRVYLIPDEQGRAQHPSIINYPGNGPPVVGWDARDLLVRDPRRTVSSIKRLLGRTFSDPHIAGYLHSASYLTVQGPNDTILVDIDGNHYAVGQVCSAIIGHVRDIAERRLGITIRQVVMSAPVSFTESEKAALRRAAQLAGLEVIALLEEPVAGALAYGIGQDRNEIVAVYDFGGGTFDFTVLDLSGDRVRVLASEGDSWLGGDDFDLALAQAVADAFWRATKIEIRQRVVEWQRLLLACEQAKRDLSDAATTFITVDRLVETPRRMDLKQRLDRPVFERLCHELVDRSLAVCRDALQRAGLDPSDVTQVVMTGGVSRVPAVREGVARFFDRQINAVVHPEEAICLGAGVHAARLVEHRSISAHGR